MGTDSGQRWQPLHNIRLARKWLQPALDRDGNKHNFEDIYLSVLKGDMQLWQGPRGAAITQVIDFPNARVLHVLLAGGAMQQILDFEESAAAWGRSIGCTSMTLNGRMGWQRILTGWDTTSVMMERPLWQADCSADQRAKPAYRNGQRMQRAAI